MPLLVLPASEALKNVRNATSRWPRTADAQAERLMPLAQPAFSPSFKISRDELIFTIGSCFARNIEKQLVQEGYNVAASRFQPPEDTGFKADPDALLNRFVVYAIANELRWGLGHGKPFRDRYYAQAGKDLWFDPHLHPSIEPSALGAVIERREAVRQYMALAGKARTVIMTLGLAEAWYDARNALYLNGVLPAGARSHDPDRFQFHVLDYQQILDCLNFIHHLLEIRGHPQVRILVTVSPVAMNTTFTGGEVLVANTYSKAVQRAAVEAFVRSHANVDYFPSYESVILSDRRRAWREDQAHASDEIVRLNVLRMVEAYGQHGEEATDESGDPTIQSVAGAFALARSANEAADRGEVDVATRFFEDAIRIAPAEGLILLDFGRFLFSQRQFDDASRLVRDSIRHGSAAYGGYFLLAQILRASGAYAQAFKAARLARNLQPTRPGLLHLSAEIAEKLERYEEALAFAESCVALEPTSEPFQRLVERLRRLAKRREGLETLKSMLRVGRSASRR